MFAADLHGQGGAGSGQGAAHIAQADAGLQRRRPAATGDGADGLVVVEDRVAVSRDGTTLQVQTHQATFAAPLNLPFQGIAADEGRRILQMDQPAEPRFQGAGVLIHVLSVEMHRRFQAQAVACSQAAGAHSALQEP